jgi:hypothetical protein
MMKSNVAIRICGWVWLFAGVLLLRKGVQFASQLASSSEPVFHSGVFAFLCKMMGSSQSAAIAIVLVALALGFMKARTVLAKAASRNIVRLQQLESVSVAELFDAKMWILMAAMMGMGLLINRVGLAFEWRAFIDVTVGCALMMGATQYLKERASSRA